MSDEQKQKLYILMGVPGSGKTAFAYKLMESLGDDTVYVSKDIVRNEVGDKVFSLASENRVVKEYARRIGSSLTMGYDVIADATNLLRNERDIYFAICEALKKANIADVDVIGIFISTPLTACLERNAARDGVAKLSDDKIEEIYSKIEEPVYEEGFKIILNKN